MAKVLKDFKCKVTKRVYRAGDQYDGDRAEELQALGYVAAGEDVEPNPVKKQQETENNQDAVTEPEEKPQEVEADEVDATESAEKPRKRAKRNDSG